MHPYGSGISSVKDHLRTTHSPLPRAWLLKICKHGTHSSSKDDPGCHLSPGVCAVPRRREPPALRRLRGAGAETQRQHPPTTRGAGVKGRFSRQDAVPRLRANPAGTAGRGRAHKDSAPGRRIPGCHTRPARTGAGAGAEPRALPRASPGFSFTRATRLVEGLEHKMRSG